MFRPGIIQYTSTRPRGFITEWTLTPALGLQIELAINFGNSSHFNCTILWGDGTQSTLTDSTTLNRYHTYANYGTYQVEVLGQFEGFSMYASGFQLKNKLTDIIYWGDSSAFGGFKYLSGAFYACYGVKSLGAGTILAAGSGVTTFQSAFMGTCRGATPIDVQAGLFSAHPNVGISGFYETFKACLNLRSLPAGLFDNQPSVTNNGFYQTFQDCTALETVPNHLFRNNVAVSSNGFRETFQRCNKMQQNQWIFYASGEQSTRFLNRTSSFIDCFQRTSFTGTQGTAPDLWACSFGSVVPDKNRCWGGAGNSLTSLSNYASIPAVWRV